MSKKFKLVSKTSDFLGRCCELINVVGKGGRFLISLEFNKDFFKLMISEPKEKAFRSVDCFVKTHDTIVGELKGVLLDYNYIFDYYEDLEENFRTKDKEELIAIFENYGKKEEFLLALDEGTTDILDCLDETSYEDYCGKHYLVEEEYYKIIEKYNIEPLLNLDEYDIEDITMKYDQIIVLQLIDVSSILLEEVFEELIKYIELVCDYNFLCVIDNEGVTLKEYRR